MRSTTMLPSSPLPSDRRSLIRNFFIYFAITIVALWTLYLIRSPLLLFYVCVPAQSVGGAGCRVQWPFC
jgi:hypothetical protein